MNPLFIQNVGILDELSSKDLITFYSICHRKKLKKNEYLFHTSTEASTLYIVLEGQVNLSTVNSTGTDKILAVAGPKDIIGIAFLNENEVYKANAIAREAALVCPVMRDQFIEISVRVPNFALNYSRLLTNQIFECRSKLQLSSAPLKARVAHVLCEQAQKYGTPQDDGSISIHTRLTHDELASLVSATRSSVSLAIGELRTEGLIKGTRGKYRLILSDLQASIDDYN